MNGCTVIGFAYGHVRGYCKRCKKIFGIGYNEIRPLSRDDSCPFCKKSDEVETDDWIDNRIDMIKMFVDNDMTNYAQASKIKERLSELYMVKEIFEVDKKRRK